MKRYTLFERCRHKISEMLIPVLASYRRKKLNNTDFTIISNNCWAGICYEYYGLRKLSPTIGLYFFADDYIKFISHLQFYVNKEIKFISIEQSKYKDKLLARGQKNVPIGILDDVEIVFLHYSDAKVAKEKWERRVKRINWENLIFKFSFMNECTEEHVHKFEEVVGTKKSFVLVNRRFDEYNNAIVISEEEQIGNDTFYWNKYFDVSKFINTGEICVYKQ